jgi:CubicO group peptidase (beta-lactamase class C family)
MDISRALGLLFFSVASYAATVVSYAATAANEHIDQIQNHLLPPVLVKGEPLPATRLSDRMAELHVPGVSVAVIHNGKLEWAHGFGVVRLGGPAVTPETEFQAASISKSVTTLAAMRLVAGGKINLDTDINQSLHSWKLPANQLTQQQPVTLRELLSHTAGTTVHGFAGYASDEPLPTLVQILNGEPPANSAAILVDLRPGTRPRYSGGGYEIVQQALMDVTGMPFAQLMHDTVLQPLGMRHSTYEQPAPPTILALAATPYRGDGSPVKGGPHVYPEQAAAGLWTTPSDLARMAIGVQKSLAGEPGSILPLGIAHTMLTPMFPHQGIGFFVWGNMEKTLFTHSGANEGYRCDLVAYRHGDGAVIMTSGDNGGDITSQIMRTLAHDYHWPDYAPAERTLAVMAPSSFDTHVGAYRLESGNVVTFWREDDHLESRVVGQGPVELFPTSDHEYFSRGVDARWEFEADTATLYQNNASHVAKRLHGAEAQIALDSSAGIQNRIKDQTPAPGGEALLRRLIDGLASGNPHYEDLGPGLARLTRDELPGLIKAIASSGALQTLSFKSVSPQGADVYEVTFEHGVRQFRIVVESDGRIHSAWFSN